MLSKPKIKLGVLIKKHEEEYIKIFTHTGKPDPEKAKEYMNEWRIHSPEYFDERYDKKMEELKKQGVTDLVHIFHITANYLRGMIPAND